MESLSSRHLHRSWLLFTVFVILFHVTTSQETSRTNHALPSQPGEAGYIFELRESVLVIGENTTQNQGRSQAHRPCRGSQLSKEKKSLLRKLQKPKLAINYSMHHIRYRLLTAIDGFQRYGERAETIIQSKRDLFQDLSKDQQKLINKITSYQEKLESASAGLRQNAALANSVADYALRFYGIQQQEVDSHVAQLTSDGRASDYTSVSQALKHFVRDWSDDGIEERDASFPQILETLNELFPLRNDTDSIQVLIPGSGVGRLAHAVDDLTGFHVTSNEYSAYMNLAYRYIASLSKPHTRIFSPYCDSWSHQATTGDLLRQVTFPDTIATPDRVVHVEGDFTTAFSQQHGTYDVVVTLFFIDTARNLLSYFETIHALLKPGGKWINLGPLLYGSRPMLELSVDEIVKLVEEMGFTYLETKEKWGQETLEGQLVRGKEARYGLNSRLLTKNSYMAQFWVAEKDRSG